MEMFKYHEFISGQPRKGKSYYIQDKLKDVKYPVLYISTKEENFDRYIKANKYSPLKLISSALKDKRKIFYKLDYERKVFEKEIYYLCKILFTMKQNNKKCLVVFDECHNYCYEGQQDNSAYKVAQEGLYDIKAFFISQYPANVSNRVLRSCELHTFFSMSNFEEKYAKSYGFDVELIKAGLINQYDKVQVLNGEVVRK